MSSEETDSSDSIASGWQHQYQRDRLDLLSPTQLTATRWKGDLTVVIGGPGTGKSTTIGLLLDRLTDEQEVAPDECMVLSFNRSVATETRAGLETELGGRGHEVEVRTAHAKAREVLSQAPAAVRSTPIDAEIANEVDQQLAMQGALRQTLDDQTVTKGRIKGTLNSINTLK
jgi:superfamily I DNA/RNA helicase